ncbi:rpap2 [Plakobranchus ocellatus]|uniref:RNA polymerase II subunit B1 CTD phosphatase RPAP2 homolog n=1 Tax=Plakobranchus ocellatus TaxID=259542 RepID=A0AAV3Z9Z7_9GAST|nr:rpap2 [Plakobranchus ocellatus]
MMPHSSQQENNSDVKSQKLKTIEKTIRSQVECEERAFHIVNKLIESHVDGDYLVECGKLINATHYTDIIEERTISRLCGYPVCPNSLGEIPKNKYHISTRTNKVYEISERKVSQLEKDNIVLKPGEWTLAALFILKMLAVKYPRIESSFSSQAALRHFSAVLTRLGQSLAQLHTLTEDILSVAELDNR